MDSPRAREVFAAAERMRVRKVWVGSDAWSARTSVTDDYESAVRGSVTLQPLAADIKDFDSYFTRFCLPLSFFFANVCQEPRWMHRTKWFRFAVHAFFHQVPIYLVQRQFVVACL